jgi:hypothetical protein
MRLKDKFAIVTGAAVWNSCRAWRLNEYIGVIKKTIRPKQ